MRKTLTLGTLVALLLSGVAVAEENWDAGVAVTAVDEWRSLSEQFGSTREVPAFSPGPLSTAVTVTPEDWAMLREIDGDRTIAALSTTMGLSTLETCSGLKRLMELGLVVLQPNCERR